MKQRLFIALTVALLGAAAAARAQDTAPAEPARPTPDAVARPTGVERLELGTTTITGSQELPRVMYVVPWKHPQAGELEMKAMQSLVDEALAPVDREVFKRENSYFRVLEPSPEARVEKPVTASRPAP